MDDIYLKEHDTTKERILEWLDDLIIDAGIDKPYEMDSEDRGIYCEILDILEEHFNRRKK